MAVKSKKTSASTVKKTSAKTLVGGSPAVSAFVPATKPAVAVPPPAKVPASAPTLKGASAAERAKMIEVAAYLLAEKNSFRGDAKAYWLQAEKDVNAKLGRK